jgi:hypothetical protein
MQDKSLRSLASHNRAAKRGVFRLELKFRAADSCSPCEVGGKKTVDAGNSVKYDSTLHLPSALASANVSENRTASQQRAPLMRSIQSFNRNFAQNLSDPSLNTDSFDAPRCKPAHAPDPGRPDCSFPTRLMRRRNFKCAPCSWSDPRGPAPPRKLLTARRCFELNTSEPLSVYSLPVHAPLGSGDGRIRSHPDWPLRSETTQSL